MIAGGDTLSDGILVDKYIAQIKAELSAARAELASKDAEIGRLREHTAHIQKWGCGSYACHVAPDKQALERNRTVEAEGERIRRELVDFLERNQIVGISLDTDHHVVRVDIDRLPPNIKPVLTLWGSIYVRDKASEALAGKQEGQS